MTHAARRSIGNALQFSFDTVGLVAAWHGTINLRLLLNPFMQRQLTREDLYLLAPPVYTVLLLWIAAGVWLHAYRPPKKQLAGGRFANLIESVILASMLIIVATFFFRQFGADLSRSFVLLFMPVCLTCMLAARYLGVLTRTAGEKLWPAPERVAVLGNGVEAREVAEHVRSADARSVMLAGLILPGESSDEAALVASGPVLGTTKRLAEVINRTQIDRIIVANGCITDREVDECGVISKRMGVVLSRAMVVPKVAVQVEFGEHFGLPLLNVRPVAFSRVQEIVKRCFDIVLAGASIVLLVPLTAAIAILIKLTSDGPILYKSRRVGRGGRYFTFVKFRSMYANKMERQHVLRDNEKSGHLFKMRKDPRVTPLGRFMRKYSLDELPQLFNVLRGEMSLVGPRPLPAEDLDPDGQSHEFRAWSEQRSRVLPGITGLWQINGRSDLTFERMIELDIDYIRKWSLDLDLRILLETPLVVLVGKGAY
jgi:exopolysaccharide biosynthesis polyprenyl glycosylphosphotransferase